MAAYVKVPTFGLAISNVDIMEWLVKEGAKVKEGDALCSVETDKANFEVNAPADGVVLKILYDTGSRVKVDDTVVAVIGEENEDISGFLSGNAEQKEAGPAAEKADKKPEDKAVHTPDAGKSGEKTVHAMPLVRNLAKKYGIDIGQIKGTGKGGLITEKDVEDYHKNIPAGVDEVIPFTGVRKTIAGNLSKSKNSAVHVTTTVEVDMTECDSLRKMLKDSLYEKEGIKLSFVPFFIKAANIGLKEFPILNSALQDEAIIIKKSVNFGIAVDSPRGLLVPVLKDSQALGFWELARKINEMVVHAKDGKIEPEFIGGGTISFSNAGAYGAVLSTPIIQYPQSAVVWAGAIREKPAVKDGAITIRKMMYLSVSYDHRIMDGAKVAKFLGIMKKALENPALIMMD